MIETPARVTRLEGDLAWVVSEAPSSCGACAGKGCGSSVFNRLWHPNSPEYAVSNPIAAQPGDAVVIGLPDGALLRAATSGYVLPLAAVLVGAALGQAWLGEPAAIAGGLFGLVFSAWGLRRRKTAAALPSILRTGGVACSGKPA